MEKKPNVRMAVNMYATLYLKAKTPYMAYKQAREWYLKGEPTDDKEHYNRFHWSGLNYGSYDPNNKGEEFDCKTIDDYRIKDGCGEDAFEVTILLLFDKKMHLDCSNPNKEIYDMFCKDKDLFVNKDNLISIDINGKRLDEDEMFWDD